MSLNPVDEIHALQIQAGILGRRAGHAFEDAITNAINSNRYPFTPYLPNGRHVFTGNPALLLLSYVCQSLGITEVFKATAISTGALATSENGKRWLSINGLSVLRCKSDLVLTIRRNQHDPGITVGVSTKQCNNSIPTNAQLYFTTANGFANLLINNGIIVTANAIKALRQFCGEVGYRPLDDSATSVGRTIDPRRYFWEEIESTGRMEWEGIISTHQDQITRLLLQKAYINDPFAPDFLLHKTKYAPFFDGTEVALYSIDQLINLSRAYQGFNKKNYAIRKGSYRDPVGVMHEAPRFGIVQMQRGGQRQHPDQLQFNLESGYFYKI